MILFSRETIMTLAVFWIFFLLIINSSLKNELFFDISQVKKRLEFEKKKSKRIKPLIENCDAVPCPGESVHRKHQ